MLVQKPNDILYPQCKINIYKITGVTTISPNLRNFGSHFQTILSTMVLIPDYFIFVVRLRLVLDFVLETQTLLIQSLFVWILLNRRNFERRVTKNKMRRRRRRLKKINWKRNLLDIDQLWIDLRNKLETRKRLADLHYGQVTFILFTFWIIIGRDQSGIWTINPEISGLGTQK